MDMAMDMLEALAKLDEVRQAMHDQFPENSGRLGQLDSALATADMAVEHLFDEEMRHVDLVKRILSTPRGLRADDPSNAAERSAHQVRPGAID
jgi:hypothetical protein